MDCDLEIIRFGDQEDEEETEMETKRASGNNKTKRELYPIKGNVFLVKQP